MVDKTAILARYFASKDFESTDNAKRILSEISREDCRQFPAISTETMRNCLRYIGEKDGEDTLIDILKDVMKEPEELLLALIGL